MTPAMNPTRRQAAADWSASVSPVCPGPKKPTAASRPPTRPATSAGSVMVRVSRTPARTSRTVSSAPVTRARAQGTVTAGWAPLVPRAHQAAPETTTRLPVTVAERSSTRSGRPSLRSIWPTKASSTLKAMTTAAAP